MWRSDGVRFVQIPGQNGEGTLFEICKSTFSWSWGSALLIDRQDTLFFFNIRTPHQNHHQQSDVDGEKLGTIGSSLVTEIYNSEKLSANKRCPPKSPNAQHLNTDAPNDPFVATLCIRLNLVRIRRGIKYMVRTTNPSRSTKVISLQGEEGKRSGKILRS